MSHALQLFGIVVGATAVIIQLWLAVELFTSQGMSLPGAFIAFFSFFTILTNIYAIKIYLAEYTESRLGFFRRPVVRANAAVAMAIVAVVYHVLLADIWNPQGLQYVTDKMLHYVAPAIMVVWWLLYGRDGSLRWRDLPKFLIYPLVYLAYVLARSTVAGTVPYPFLDYVENGWQSVVVTSLGITVLFVVVAALAIAADRRFPQPASDRTAA